MLSNSHKKNIKQYGSSGAIASLIAFTFLSSLYLVILYVLMQEQLVTKWVKKYLTFLLNKQPKNPFLRLFSKNLDKIINKEYLLAYSKNVFIGFGVSILISVSLLLLILAVNYKSSKTSDKDVEDEGTNSQIALFVLMFSASAVIITIFTFIAMHKLLSDVGKMIIGYLDDAIPNDGNNPFLEVFKKIINGTFQHGLEHDLILEMKDKFSTFSYIMFTILFFVFAISAVYLIYDNRKEKEEKPGIKLNGVNVDNNADKQESVPAQTNST